VEIKLACLTLVFFFSNCGLSALRLPLEPVQELVWPQAAAVWLCATVWEEARSRHALAVAHEVQREPEQGQGQGQRHASCR
tara:strand:- start:671 stop:913 length:243 start_codon:yes stop_codon:yes gene_type:complete